MEVTKNGFLGVYFFMEMGTIVSFTSARARERR